MQRTIVSCFFQHLHIHSFYTVPDRIPRRKALLVGVRDVPMLFSHEMNVPGAHQDAKRFRNLLIRKYGYKQEDIVVLKDDPDMTDDQRARLWPTRSNIMREMGDLIRNASSGDCFVFMYSGHGSQVMAVDDLDEKDGLDEIIFAADSAIDPNSSSNVPLVNYIKDDEIRTTLMRLPAGASCVMVFDCCHSGTAAGMSNHCTCYGACTDTFTSRSRRHDVVAKLQTIHPASPTASTGLTTNRFEPGRYATLSTSFRQSGPNLTSWSACKDANITVGNSRGGGFLRAFCQALYNDPTPMHAELLRNLSEEIDRVIEQVPEKFREGLEDLPIPQLGSSRPHTILQTRFTL
ncbi:peptidase C14 [Trametes gibbosa]|nr:peptidase C14 [Trametes gibbosa]